MVPCELPFDTGRLWANASSVHYTDDDDDDVFSWPGQAIGRSNVTKHEIHTENSRPAWIPPRRIPVHYEQELSELIADMLKRNIIKPSTSPWSSPLMLVHKKDGSLRVCVDYRKLNSITKRDSFPLPRIDTTFDALRGSPVFSIWPRAIGKRNSRTLTRLKLPLQFHPGCTNFKPCRLVYPMPLLLSKG